MNPKLIEFIRALSAADKKNLTQRAGKASEEIGELWGKILPYEDAFGLTDRFVGKQQILDECADSILAVLSIAYGLGFSDDELEDMLKHKAEKWALKQARAARTKYPVPFEMHVTVQSAERESFTTACLKLGVKPIFLALQSTSAETVLHDVMTSSVLLGNNTQALEEVERIATGLTAAGFNVVRKKIETVPWHPAAPSSVDGVKNMPPGGYFESHINTIVHGDVAAGPEDPKAKLQDIAKRHNAHLSRNVFKVLTDGLYTQMLTLRAYEGTREEFERARDALSAELTQTGFGLEKVITEFSIYDTRTNHDSAWLSAA